MTWGQVHRLTCGVFAVAIFLLMPAVVANLLTAGTPAPVWWSSALCSAYGALTFAIVVYAMHARNPQRLARVFVGLTLVGLVSYPLVSVAPLDHGDQPWVFYLVPSAVGACAVAFDRWRAVIGAAIFAIVRVAVLALEESRMSAEELILDAALIFVTGAVILVPLDVMRSQARALVSARQAALAAFAEAGAIRAAERETARWQALLHDDVLAALTAASGSRSAEDRRAASQAATIALERLRRDPTSSAASGGEFAQRLMEAVREVSPAVLVYIPRSEAGADVTAEAAEAVIDATVEAARNALTHSQLSRQAGEPEILVRLEWVGNGLRVVIADRGIGFDTERVPIDRLGIVVSIRARMAAVGGAADVRSGPGQGTKISLFWSSATAPDRPTKNAPEVTGR